MQSVSAAALLLFAVRWNTRLCIAFPAVPVRDTALPSHPVSSTTLRFCQCAAVQCEAVLYFAILRFRFVAMPCHAMPNDGLRFPALLAFHFQCGALHYHARLCERLPCDACRCFSGVPIPCTAVLYVALACASRHAAAVRFCHCFAMPCPFMRNLALLLMLCFSFAFIRREIDQKFRFCFLYWLVATHQPRRQNPRRSATSAIVRAK